MTALVSGSERTPFSVAIREPSSCSLEPEPEPESEPTQPEPEPEAELEREIEPEESKMSEAGCTPAEVRPKPKPKGFPWIFAPVALSGLALLCFILGTANIWVDVLGPGGYHFQASLWEGCLTTGVNGTVIEKCQSLADWKSEGSRAVDSKYGGNREIFQSNSQQVATCVFSVLAVLASATGVGAGATALFEGGERMKLPSLAANVIAGASGLLAPMIYSLPYGTDAEHWVIRNGDGNLITFSTAHTSGWFFTLLGALLAWTGCAVAQFLKPGISSPRDPAAAEDLDIAELIALREKELHDLREEVKPAIAPQEYLAALNEQLQVWKDIRGGNKRKSFEVRQSEVSIHHAMAPFRFFTGKHHIFQPVVRHPWILAFVTHWSYLILVVAMCGFFMYILTVRELHWLRFHKGGDSWLIIAGLLCNIVFTCELSRKDKSLLKEILLSPSLWIMTWYLFLVAAGEYVAIAGLTDYKRIQFGDNFSDNNGSFVYFGVSILLLVMSFGTLDASIGSSGLKYLKWIFSVGFIFLSVMMTMLVQGKSPEDAQGRSIFCYQNLEQGHACLRVNEVRTSAFSQIGAFWLRVALFGSSGGSLLLVQKLIVEPLDLRKALQMPPTSPCAPAAASNSVLLEDI